MVLELAYWGMLRLTKW